MKFQVYLDSANQWRWRLLARGKRIVADSGEGYSGRIACVRAIHSIINQAATAKIEYLEAEPAEA